MYSIAKTYQVSTKAGKPPSEPSYAVLNLPRHHPRASLATDVSRLPVPAEPWRQNGGRRRLGLSPAPRTPR